MKALSLTILTVCLLFACSTDRSVTTESSAQTVTELDLVLASGTPPDPNGSPSEGLFDRKEEIVREVERRMRIVLGEAVRRFDDIRERCDEEESTLKPPFVLESVETPLKKLYNQQENVFAGAIQKITDKYLHELDSVLEYLVNEKSGKIWEIAFEVVGSEDVGMGYDMRTGIKDVDDVARATIELVRFRAGRDEFVDDSEYQKRKRVRLARIFKHEIEGQAKLEIYASEPLYHFFSPNEDGLAYSIVLQSTRSDAPPFEFRQAIRNRVVRGGSTLFDSGFHWDHSLGSPTGRLESMKIPIDPTYQVSKVILPRLNLEAPSYEQLLDHSAVRDYKTAVVDGETGEVIMCVSWQITWQISHRGFVTVDKGSSPLIDEESREITHLLSQG